MPKSWFRSARINNRFSVHTADGDWMSACESLESRQFLSTTTLRIAAYNLDADTNGNTAPNPGVTAVLQAIGSFGIQGIARPVDVLALEETTSNAQTVQPIVAALNGVYGAGTYAASPLQLTESNGDPSTGNGPSALIYNTKTVTLLQSVAVPGSLGASTGVYRQIGRYELQPHGGAAASDFYLYVEHYKAGVGTANADKRQLEAAVLRHDEAVLPADARVVYAGDFNTNANGEGIFNTLMAAGVGQAFDPRLPDGGAGNVDQSVASLSESADALRYRDDYQMVTSNVLSSATGLKIVAGSEMAFGNNGSVAYGGSITDPSNTALASLPNAGAVYQALSTASDHLPVVADYTDVLPSASGSVSGTVTGGPAGETVYLDANNNSKPDAGELTTTTAATGKYAFADVPAGAFIVRQVLTGGYTQTTPSNNYGLHVTTAGRAITGQNFVDKAPAASGTASLTGTAFNDNNRDGKYDTGDGASKAVTIFLDLDNDGILDANETSVLTDSSGKFTFKNLTAGTYHVRRVFASGQSYSTPLIDVTLTAGQAKTSLSLGTKRATA